MRGLVEAGGEEGLLGSGGGGGGGHGWLGWGGETERARAE